MTGSAGQAPATAAANGPYRRLIIDAAIEATTRSGWSSVTMAGLAETVGVSRQTVYNEVGSKPALGEAMVMQELGRFLQLVERAFDRHPDDAARALRTAVRDILRLARDDAFLRSVVSASQGGDAELLPLLTSRARGLREAAAAVLGSRLATYDLGLPPRRHDAVVDLVVRTVLSHVVQPSGTPERTADDLAWVLGRVTSAPPDADA